MSQEEMDYQKAYEEEHLRNADLAGRVADLEAKVDDLNFKLNRIKSNPVWKASAPARRCMHWCIRQVTRVKNCGSMKGVAAKIKYKQHEKHAMEQFGTKSFPDEARRKAEQNTDFPRRVKISILVPLFNTPEEFLREMIDSVMNQTYSNWELCLADGSDDAHAYVTFKSGDINKMLTMHFKPDYAIDNLRANNYICHFSVFARELLDGTELFRPQFDGSQDHDMILRLTDRAKCVVHVPKLLYYWRCHPGSVASGVDAKPYVVEAAKGAVADHLRRHGFKHFQITSTRAFETIFKIRYEIIGTPKISIVIANKDHQPDLKRCIDSILEKSTYENYEIIVVENNSTTPEIFAYYKELQAAYENGATENDRKIRVVTYTTKEGETFNYSRVNNYGVSYATGEYILLLNNDTQVITVNWMEELLMYAQRQDVAAVGAKLYYADKTIQHAGVVLGLGAHRTAGHSHYGQHRDNLGYMGRLCYAQNVSAVTGACLLVKKSLYDEVGGLSEDFAISLNDVDFCLKLREKGFLNVFTPFAELYHFESVSRGLDDQGEKAERYNKESEHFRTKWKEVLAKGDPYYNPNFSLDRSDFALKIQG